MVRFEFTFRVSDDVWVWVHNVGFERYYDFCFLIPEFSNSVVFLSCRFKRRDGIEGMIMFGGV
jgi:hypothetical protein